MNKKRLIFIGLTLLLLTLTLALSGCGKEEIDLEGKNIVVFELNGGTLDYKTSSIDTKINYAYDPGSYLLDPANIPGYSLTKGGYEFTGWYKTENCDPSSKWNFDTETVNSEKITLYAGWKKAIVYTFGLYYVEGDKEVKLGEYKVDEGEKFNDRRNTANTRAGYTFLGYYSDKAMTAAWDNTTVHPGGDTDTEIPVYLKYMEGVWKFATDLSSLKSALSAGQNVQIMNDIDCGGAELGFGLYSGIIEGNGYTVSNFTVESSGTLRKSCFIFSGLGEGAQIKNVSFKGVVFKMFGTATATGGIQIAALAKNATGATVDNVTVEGKLLTDYEGELPTLKSAFYEDNGENTVNGFSANITVEKQTEQA